MSTPEEQAHYGPYLQGLPIAVAKIGDHIGKGVLATRPIRKDEVLWSEYPIVAIQHIYNQPQALVCQQCFRFIGSLQSQADVVCGDGPRIALPDLAGFQPNAPIAPIVYCLGGCSTPFCSEACRDTAFVTWHRALCPQDDPDHPYRLLCQFSENTNDLFLLVARALASIVQAYQSNGGDLNAAARQFAFVFKAPWWEVVDVEEGLTGEERAEFLEHFHTLTEEACQFYHALFPLPGQAAGLTTKAYVGNLLGMFELNNADMTVQSPLQAYLEAARQLAKVHGTPDWLAHIDEALMADAAGCCDDGEDEEAMSEDGSNMDKGKLAADGEEPAEVKCSGNALYRLQSCLNHSCSPNAALLKGPDDCDGRVTVRALRDIAPGEEVTISYIEDAATREERQEMLREYHFTCRCHRCEAEDSAMS